MTQLSKIGSFIPSARMFPASSTIPTVMDAIAFRFFSRNCTSSRLPDAFVYSSFLGIGSWLIFNVFTRKISPLLESTGVLVVYKIGHYLYTRRKWQSGSVTETLGLAMDQLLKPLTLSKHDVTTRDAVQTTWFAHAEKVNGILQEFLSATDNLWEDLQRSYERDAKKMAEALWKDPQYDEFKKLFNYEEAISLPCVYRFIRGLSFVLETVNCNFTTRVFTQVSQHHTLKSETDFEANPLLKNTKKTYNEIMIKWAPVIQELAKLEPNMAAYLVPDLQPSLGDVESNNNPFKLHIPSIDLL